MTPNIAPYIHDAMEQLRKGYVHSAIQILGQKAELNFMWVTDDERAQAVAKAIFAALDTVPDSIGLDNKADFMIQMAAMASSRKNPELAAYAYSQALNFFERSLEEYPQPHHQLIESQTWHISMCALPNEELHARAANLWAASVRDRARTDLAAAQESVSTTLAVTGSRCEIFTQALNLQKELGEPQESLRAEM